MGTPSTAGNLGEQATDGQDEQQAAAALLLPCTAAAVTLCIFSVGADSAAKTDGGDDFQAMQGLYGLR